MAYMRPELLAQAASAGRKVQTRPPEIYEKMGLTQPQASEVSQPVAETIAVRQIDRMNQREHRTMQQAGGAIINTDDKKQKDARDDSTLFVIALIALLAFSMMKR